MKKLALMLWLACACAHAQLGDVYACIGENGAKEYKNTGITKGCKKVDLLRAPPNWVMIFSDAEKSVAYLDKDSFSIAPTQRKAWILQSYDNDQIDEVGKNYRSNKSLYLFKCQSREMALVQSIDYSGMNGAGDVVSRYAKDKKDAPFREASPNSIGEEIIKKTCSFKAAKIQK